MNKHIVTLFRICAVVCSLVLLAACAKREKQVVFIFKDPVCQTLFDISGNSYLYGNSTTVVSLVDTKGVLVHVPLVNNNDTLVVSTKSNYVEIAHRYHAFEMVNFYVEAGDTIDVTYDSSNFPVLVSHTSDELTTSYNSMNKRDRSADLYGFNPITVAGNKKLLIDNLTPQLSDSLFAEAKYYVEQQRAKLKGYSQSKAIGEEYVAYYSYLTDLMEMQLAYHEGMDRAIPIDSARVLAFLDDSKIDYVSYRLFVASLLEWFARDYYLAHVEDGARLSAIHAYDYRIIFERLERGKIPPRTFNLLRFFCVDNIVRTYPHEAYAYYEKYASSTNDFLGEKKPFSLW